PALAPAQAAQRKPVQAVAKAQAPASAAVAAAPERPAITYNELPDNIRRELPQLVIGGAMYSQTPANRMLILNGQVFHEGDKVAGELLLEQIKLKSAVLAYKGYRYSINY
ncbi:MAG: general secretion pathway protein GspB, partial [Cytophagales bacterium]|nr:general secretion pathway protein GspB [Rhizobacter sp.]